MNRLVTLHAAESRARAGRRFAGFGAIAVLSLALTGCAGVMSTGSAGSTPQLAPMMDGMPYPELSSVEGKSVDGNAADSTEQSIIRTSDLVIEVQDPQDAVDQVAQAILPLNGSIESSSVSAAGEWGAASAYLTVRVPADRLEDAISAIGGVGDVVSENRSANDVTLQHRDLTARVAALETSIERLHGLMAEATNTADLIAAESALTERQAELDGLKSQLSFLDNQVDEATISVTLNAPGTAPQAGPTNFWEAILLGVSSLGAAFVWLGLAIGVTLPWLVALALLAGIVIAIVRVARRKPAPQPQPEPQPEPQPAPSQPESNPNPASPSSGTP